MFFLKTNSSPLEIRAEIRTVVVGVPALCASLWLFALVDQLYSSAGDEILLMSMILFALADVTAHAKEITFTHRPPEQFRLMIS